MEIVSSSSHFTPTVFTCFLLIARLAAPVSAIDVTGIISSFPDLSSFSGLLSSTGVAAELGGRNSLTLLAVPNSQLGASMNLTRRLPPSYLADLLRFHVLLQFLSDSDLRRIPQSGTVVTTLYQATGRANSGSGFMNITRDPQTDSISIHSPKSSSATVLKIIKTISPNITVLAVDSLLIPAGIDLTAAETLPPPMGLNITQTLIDAHDFNVAVSMLAASGVVSELENDERGAGITLFIPLDAAFANLPTTVRLQSLPADKKAVVLKFHVLHSYYPLGSLESITNPVQPTLATEEMGAGSYTLNISRVNGSEVMINSGIVLANVSRTVFDQNPVVIFGVSEVLLPRELFGRDQTLLPGLGSPGSNGTVDRPPEISPPPGSDNPQSRLSSPPQDINSAAVQRAYVGLGLCCIALYVLV